jgi:hypothetical protein
MWNKGIDSVFGYLQEEVDNDANWWFDKIIPEYSALKMSIIPFI